MKQKARRHGGTEARRERDQLSLRGFVASWLCAYALPTLALAAPTQDDILRGISEGVGQSFDTGKMWAAVMIVAALTLLIILFNARQKREARPKSLVRPGKLLKEVARQIHLRPAQLKQLKTIADQQGLSNPLVLLLCPSLLKKKRDAVGRDGVTQ